MGSLVMTGGGTLGHCAPNLAVYPYLKGRFDKIYYIGTVAGPERKAVEGIMEYMPITATKLIRSFSLKNLAIPLKLTKGVREATAALERARADVVFSKGGFVSVPVAIAAKRLKVPLVCHESDITMGLANRLTKNKCKLILTAFEETAQGIENGVYVGQPVRDEVLINKRAYALKKYGLSGKRPVVLVIGGSSGSKAINDLILDNLDALISKYDIIHICGDKHINGLKRRGYVQLGFETDMAAAYSASNFCVSRCGAGVAFELFARGIPTVFIPLPKACSRGDQIENAAYFEKRGLSLTLTEEQACIRALEKKLEYLEKNAALFKKRAAALDTVGAAKRVADIVCAAAAK